MNDSMSLILRALANTGIWIALLLAGATILAVIAMPLILVLTLEGPDWAAILAGVWAVMTFIFTIALLQELE